MIFSRLTKRRRLLSGYEFNVEYLRDVIYNGELTKFHLMAALNLLTPTFKHISTAILIIAFENGGDVPVHGSVCLIRNFDHNDFHSFYPDEDDRYKFLAWLSSSKPIVKYNPYDYTTFFGEHNGLDDREYYRSYITTLLNIQMHINPNRATINLIGLLVSTASHNLCDDHIWGVPDELWEKAPDRVKFLKDLIYGTVGPEAFPADMMPALLKEIGSTAEDNWKVNGCGHQMEIIYLGLFKVYTLLDMPKLAAKYFRRTSAGYLLGKEWALYYKPKVNAAVEAEEKEKS